MTWHETRKLKSHGKPSGTPTISNLQSASSLQPNPRLGSKFFGKQYGVEASLEKETAAVWEALGGIIRVKKKVTAPDKV